MTKPHPSLLGRHEQFDPESRRYPIRRGLHSMMTLAPISVLWPISDMLDQGVRLPEFDPWDPSGCTGFSEAHVAKADPIQQPLTAHDAFALYRRAQELDGHDWPEGSSVLAAAQASVELGYTESYWWAFSKDEIVQSLPAGPGIVGSAWLDSMWTPDSRGFLHLGGNEVGGHAYCIGGLILELDAAVIYQTWGAGWSNITDQTVLMLLDRYGLPDELWSHVGLIALDDLWELVQAGGEYRISLDHVPAEPLPPIEPTPPAPDPVPVEPIPSPTPEPVGCLGAVKTLGSIIRDAVWPRRKR